MKKSNTRTLPHVVGPDDVPTPIGAVPDTAMTRERSVRTLLLNATHEPLAVVAARRAVVLILAGKAECVLSRDTGTVFRSPTAEMAIPAVLRLHRYIRVPYPTAMPVSRAGVLRRDRRRCAYCRQSGDTVDHVVPRSRGGAHTWENCVACCSRCNSRKADRLLAELGWTLPFLPQAPFRVGSSRLWLGDDADPAWRPWLSAA